MASAAPIVLDDDTYTRAMDAVIRRSFFPDLDQLKARTALLDPAGAATPDAARARLAAVLRDTEPILVNGSPLDLSTITLNEFLQRFTSEDAASFSDLFRKHQQEHRKRHRWLFESDVCFKDQLLRMGGEAAVRQYEEEQERRRVELAERHALMPPPPPRQITAQEQRQQLRKPAEINYSGTRLEAAPVTVGKDLTAFAARPMEEALFAGFASDLDLLARRKLLSEQPKYNLDDLRRLPDSPRVNGFGFVATPQFSPGSAAGLSPLMTWGAVATPLTLSMDANDYLQGPVFSIAEQSKRDERAKRLADEAARRMRQEKAAKQPKALGRALPSPASTLRTPKSTTASSPASSVLLSPAAQELAKRFGKVRPASDLFGSAKRPRSAASTPSLREWRALGSAAPSPVLGHPAATGVRSDGPSITDGLLKI
nr:Splicing factor ESS-2 homolog [Euglena gracilis]